MGVWLSVGLMPNNFVELPEFIEIINLLQPKFKVSDRLTFSQKIISNLANNLAQKN